ncbi:MAG TPA: hypothetical protein VFA81_09710 [Burkholderiales bacterium]|nr:hypothetical protein [Burkholderiales bacterium]
MKSVLAIWTMLGFGVVLLSSVSGAALAADYCCACKSDKLLSIEAGDELSAGLECTLKCKRPTKAKAGKCQVPGASPAAAPQATTAPSSEPPPASANKVSLFTSEDCSGDAKRVSSSSSRLADQGVTGARSYMVEAGAPAMAWEKADYAGRSVQPVGAGLCISPGWEIASIRLGKL